MSEDQVFVVTQPMHQPPHPGTVLKETVIKGLGLTVTDAAARLDVDRVTLSRLMNGQAALSVEMALRLSKSLNTSPEMWLNLQRSYDVWRVRNSQKVDLLRVRPFAEAPMLPL
jgi:addiction module HigA family antidote